MLSANLRRRLALTSLAIAPLSAQAASINGLNIPSDFGGYSVATQTIQTNYIDDLTPIQRRGEGSELDQLFVHPDTSDGLLKIGVTGNLDNKPTRGPTHGVVVFLDTKPGGDATLDGNSGGAIDDGDRYVTLLEGTRFDAGFAPDYALIVNASSPASFPEKTFFVDLIDLQSNTKRYIGRGLIASGTGVLTPNDNPRGLLFAIDNGNTLGVAGASPGVPDPNAATATSGMEIAIPLADLGLATRQQLGIQVVLASTFSSTRHPNGVSNQILPPLPDFTANIPTGFVVDFRAYAGDQFATVQLVPEPTTYALLLFAAILMTRQASRNASTRTAQRLLNTPSTHNCWSSSSGVHTSRMPITP